MPLFGRLRQRFGIYVSRLLFVHARNDRAVAAPPMVQPMSNAGNGRRGSTEIAGDGKIRFAFCYSFSNGEALGKCFELWHGAEVSEECRALLSILERKKRLV